MTLFIDADACPVTADALAVARRAGVAVVIAGNTTQNLERHVRPGDPRDAAHARRGFWVDTLAVSTGADSADFAIVESLQPGDVVRCEIDGIGVGATNNMITGACPYTWPWNVLGWPSVNVPAGFTEAGLPIGAQLMGTANTEPMLMSSQKMKRVR